MDKSLGTNNSYGYENTKNPPYNDYVHRIVEDGKKFEIKFAEKKKKENFMQTLMDKNQNGGGGKNKPPSEKTN